MNLIIYISAGVLAIYVLFILYIWIGWIRSLERKKENNSNRLAFSVIIPYRNEAANLKKLIDSLNEVQYPENLVEFIFVNDNSEDNSEALLQDQLNRFKYSARMINLYEPETGKKKALLTGINASSNEYIITTDADCLYSANWIEEINKSFSPGIEFVIGAVMNHDENKLVSGFQQIESIMLCGITIGSANNHAPLLCSGANLAFSKKLFQKVQPYNDNLHIPSGDDMFFLEKVKKEAKQMITCLYKKDGVVYTKGSESLKAMLARSVRWAGKSTHLKSFSSMFFGGIVLITNVSLLILLLLSIFYFEYINIFIKLCTIKFIVDLLLFLTVAGYYKCLNKVYFVPLMVLFYPLYLALTAILMLVANPTWKNRNY